jgi:hypothetical protein
MAKTMRLAEVVNMDNFVIGIDHAL